MKILDPKLYLQGVCMTGDHWMRWIEKSVPHSTQLIISIFTLPPAQYQKFTSGLLGLNKHLNNIIVSTAESL